jgi:hypothetical protein
MFEDTGCNEEGAVTTEEGITGFLALYEETPKDKKKCLSRQSSTPDFVMSSSRTRTSPAVLLATGDDETDELPTVQEKVSR